MQAGCLTIGTGREVAVGHLDVPNRKRIDMKAAEEITRQQLYDMVWEEPASALSPRLGLSDRGLAKVCERLGVPRPSRGYWAKKRAGHRIRPRKLPSKHDGPTIYHRPERTKAPKLEEPESVQRQRAYELEHPITVPERSGRRPPLVRRSDDILRQQDGRTRPIRGALNVGVSKGQLSRALRIMSTLYRELDRRGFTVSVDDNRTHADVGGTAVEIRLEEPYRKEYGPPTDWELCWAEMDGREPKPSYELVPTGRLSLKILEYAEGLRKTFRDTKRTKVEEKLNDFMVSLVAVAEAIGEQKRQRLEWQRRLYERTLAKAEDRRRIEQEKRRIDELRTAARRWEEANRLRAYVAAARDTVGPEPTAEATAWLSWAEHYATHALSEALLPSGAAPEA